MLIRLIGPVETHIDGNHNRISAPKLACVLAALAVRPGDPVSLQELITRVWGTDPPESAIAVLYSYVARLRAMFRHTEEIQINRAGSQGYWLEAAPGVIDVQAIRDLTAEAGSLAASGDTWQALQKWRQAGELANGEALVGIGGQWAEDIRSAFQRERLQLLVNRYGAELALGHHRAIVDELTEVLVREPLAEPIAGHLMLAQYRSGRPAAALECFETTRRRLRDRLGADPSPQLRRLHHRILNQDPALDPPAPETTAPMPRLEARPVPAQLPADTVGFVGRKAEAAAIYAASTDRRVVVIDGMAGVGKTALALHTAHQLAPEYPDGQLFLDLRGYTEDVRPITPDNALVQLLRSLNTEVPDSGPERSAALRTALAGRRVLLVLDNAVDSAQVRPLLPGNPNCLTIVTSRRRLVDLVEARPVSLEILPPRQAAEVFAAEAGLVEDSPVVDEIAAACSHLPLALRIAASRLRNRPSWTPEDLLSRLNSGQAALRELDAAGRGVVAAFDLSYRELDTDAQRVFRLLSVFPGTELDHHITAALVGTDTDTAEELLERLVDSHLLQSSGPGRYRMHDLLRHYAATAITDEAERDAAWRRLADRYVWQAWRALEFISPHSAAWPRLVTPDEAKKSTIDTIADAESWIQTQLGVLENLVHNAIQDGRDDYVIDLCVPVQGYLLRHGGGSDVRLPLAEAAAQAARRLKNTAAEARMTNYIGTYYSDIADVDTATRHFRRAIALWRDIGDVAGEVAAANNMASIEANQGNDAAAVERYRNIIDLAKDAGLTFQELHIRISASGALYEHGRIDEAAEQLDRAEELLGPARPQRQLIRLQFQRSVILCERGDTDAAEQLCTQVVDYCRDNQIPDALVSGLWGICNAQLKRNDYTAALIVAQEQLDILERWNLPFREIQALVQLGQAHAGLGQTKDAVEVLRAAISLAERIGAVRISARAKYALGELLLGDEDRTEALKLLSDAERFYTAGGYPQRAELRRRLAELTS